MSHSSMITYYQSHACDKKGSFAVSSRCPCPGMLMPETEKIVIYGPQESLLAYQGL